MCVNQRRENFRLASVKTEATGKWIASDHSALWRMSVDLCVSAKAEEECPASHVYATCKIIVNT